MTAAHLDPIPATAHALATRREDHDRTVANVLSNLEHDLRAATSLPARIALLENATEMLRGLR